MKLSRKLTLLWPVCLTHRSVGSIISLAVLMHLRKKNLTLAEEEEEGATTMDEASAIHISAMNSSHQRTFSISCSLAKNPNSTANREVDSTVTSRGASNTTRPMARLFYASLLLYSSSSV